MAIKHCCAAMEGHLTASREDSGFVISITTAPKFFGSYLVFVLEARAISQADRQNTRFPEDCRIIADTKVCIKFCPWCGKQLAKYYARFQDELTIVPHLLKDLGVRG
jgi:hypothetical protein